MSYTRVKDPLARRRNLLIAKSNGATPGGSVRAISPRASRLKQPPRGIMLLGTQHEATPPPLERPVPREPTKAAVNDPASVSGGAVGPESNREKLKMPVKKHPMPRSLKLHAMRRAGGGAGGAGGCGNPLGFTMQPQQQTQWCWAAVSVT
jgi:hypothetical protein